MYQPSNKLEVNQQCSQDKNHEDVDDGHDCHDDVDEVLNDPSFMRMFGSAANDQRFCIGH